MYGGNTQGMVQGGTKGNPIHIKIEDQTGISINSKLGQMAGT